MINTQIMKLSQRGEYHARNDQPNQDIVRKRENGLYAVAAVADGVSSCPFAREGAELACRIAIDFFMSDAEYLFDFSPEKIAYLFIELIKVHLSKAALAAEASLSDFSSTLLLCGVDKKNGRLLAINLGDGAVVIERGERSGIVLMPRRFNKSCCSTTTENAYLSAQTILTDTEDVSRICIFTDGALDRLCGADTDALCDILGHLPDDTELLRARLKSSPGADDSSSAIITLD